jgi:hypothetical protein
MSESEQESLAELLHAKARKAKAKGAFAEERSRLTQQLAHSASESVSISAAAQRLDERYKQATAELESVLELTEDPDTRKQIVEEMDENAKIYSEMVSSVSVWLAQRKEEDEKQERKRQEREVRDAKRRMREIEEDLQQIERDFTERQQALRNEWRRLARVAGEAEQQQQQQPAAGGSTELVDALTNERGFRSDGRAWGGASNRSKAPTPTGGPQAPHTPAGNAAPTPAGFRAHPGESQRAGILNSRTEQEKIEQDLSAEASGDSRLLRR